MTSLLDQMTAATRQRKEDKAATLTPVGTETGGPLAFGQTRIPEVPEVFLTGEALIDIARDLRRMVGLMLEVADGLDKHVGRTTVPLDSSEKIVAAIKAIEQTADSRAFAETFSALQASAQAATFAANDAPADEVPVAVASGSAKPGWTCPTHGDANLRDLTSTRGRKYRACKTCAQFEK